MRLVEKPRKLREKRLHDLFNTNDGIEIFLKSSKNIDLVSNLKEIKRYIVTIFSNRNRLISASKDNSWGLHPGPSNPPRALVLHQICLLCRFNIVNTNLFRHILWVGKKR